MSSFTVVKLLASVALMGLLFEHCYAALITITDSTEELKRTVRQDDFGLDFVQDEKADMAGGSTEHHVETQGEFKIGLNFLDGLTFKGDGSIDYGSKSAEAATGKFKNRSGGVLESILGFTDMKEEENNGRFPRDVPAGKRGNLKRSARSTGPFLCHGNIFQMTCYENNGNRIKRENYNLKPNFDTLGHPF